MWLLSTDHATAPVTWPAPPVRNRDDENEVRQFLIDDEIWKVYEGVAPPAASGFRPAMWRVFNASKDALKLGEEALCCFWISFSIPEKRALRFLESFRVKFSALMG